MRRLRLVLLALVVAAPAFAVQPNEMLKDPALEARARSLSAQLRCLVCQNESIDESDADLARDIRLLIRRRITAGESNQQIRDFLVSRYGDFILLKPPLNLSTLLLWLSAPLAFLAGALGIWVAIRRRPPPPAPLTADEERRLAELGTDGPA
jgi:cytochrome c-type biogenesis protein CcmH